MALSPSGHQVEIRSGPHRAVIVEVGGGVRSYDVDGVDLLDGYRPDEMVTAARGQPLLPWPNRLHGGSYRWAGAVHPVPMDEPDKGNALHGLCRYRAWSILQQGADEVLMGLRLHPSPPYPFLLDLRVHYRLGAGGLQVRTTAHNLGVTAAPYAAGAHPYLTVGVRLDEAELTVPAQSWLPTDVDQIPTGLQPVAGSEYDLRTGRRIGDLRIDYAFTDLDRSEDGLAVVRLAGPDRAVELWADQSYPYLEIFTGDAVPEPARRRWGLGVEPMTAPPNAFVTGTDLITLEPGATTAAVWGVRPG